MFHFISEIENFAKNVYVKMLDFLRKNKEAMKLVKDSATDRARSDPLAT